MKKIKYGCGDISYATCLKTEVIPNPQSSLIEEECLVQEQVNEDFYEQLENIQTQSDLSELGNLCLDYVETGGKIFVKNALLKLEEEVCALKEDIETLKTTAICDMPISGCDLTLGDLVSECGDAPVTFGDLLQILINQHITP